MRRLPLAVLAPGLALALGAAIVAAEGPSPGRLRDAALLFGGMLLTWAVAMAERRRDPRRRLWWLLSALAVGSAVQPLVASPDPVLFTLARASRPALEVLLLWVMLAFPTGRLGSPWRRALVLGALLAVLLLWVPGMMFSPAVPLTGPWVTCGSRCPPNLLLLSEQPQLAERLLTAFRLVGVGLLALASVHLLNRLRQATPLMRRTLAPVVAASLLRTAVLMLFLLRPDDGLWLSFTFWAVPAAIALGLLRGRLHTARALQHLVSGLRSGPNPQALRTLMAEALDDPGLRLGYWHAQEARWVDDQGQPLLLPGPADSRRAVHLVDDDAGRPAALLVHDRALLEEPRLLDAVASSMQAAMLTHQAEVALAAARSSAASAAERERRRIERDLHDGAQQRLLALRLKLEVSRRLLDQDPPRAAAMLAEMQADVGAALDEMRALAHGLVPPVLAERGLEPALAEAAQRCGLPVALQLAPVGRLAPASERALYFCAVEAMQNAAKHAGAGTRLSLSLARQDSRVELQVEDDGPGRADDAGDGRGLANLRQRLAEVGGALQLAARQPHGLVLRAWVPCGAEPGTP